MINEASARPFPNNLFFDLETEPPTEQAEDFFASLMYVLRCVANTRDSKVILLRYKDGKTFDEIGEAIGLTKQRVNALVQSILNKITGDYVMMLKKGIKRYYEDLLIERINDLGDVIEDSEREKIKEKAYAEGYEFGFTDGIAEKKTKSSNIDVLDYTELATMPLSVRTYGALNRNGARTLGDVVRIGDGLITFRSFGKKCFDELAEILKAYNVSVVHTFPRACAKYDWSDANE